MVKLKNGPQCFHFSFTFVRFGFNQRRFEALELQKAQIVRVWNYEYIIYDVFSVYKIDYY